MCWHWDGAAQRRCRSSFAIELAQQPALEEAHTLLTTSKDTWRTPSPGIRRRRRQQSLRMSSNRSPAPPTGLSIVVPLALAALLSPAKCSRALMSSRKPRPKYLKGCIGEKTDDKNALKEKRDARKSAIRRMYPSTPTTSSRAATASSDKDDDEGDQKNHMDQSYTHPQPRFRPSPIFLVLSSGLSHGHESFPDEFGPAFHPGSVLILPRPLLARSHAIFAGRRSSPQR